MGSSQSNIESKISEELIDKARFVKHHMNDEDYLEQLDKYYQEKNVTSRQQD